MTRLGSFSEETLAVDSISADIDLLARLAGRGGTLSEYDVELLTRCSLRLSQLIPALSATVEAAAPPSPARRGKVRPKAKLAAPTKFPANAV